MDQSVNVIEKLGGKELVNKLLDPNDHSTYKTIGNEIIKILDPRKVMAQSQNELDYLREIIMDFRPNKRIQALKLIKEGTACVRLQRCWKRKMERESGPPLSLRKLMRVGYIRGEGLTRDRRVHRTIGWTQGMVAELFSTYIHVMHHSSKMCQNPPSLATVVHRFFLCRWGCVSLAERDLHDLYLNVRNVAQRVPRCRLFAAFTSCSLRGTAADRALCEGEKKEDFTLSKTILPILTLRLFAPRTLHRLRHRRRSHALLPPLDPHGPQRPRQGG